MSSQANTPGHSWTYTTITVLVGLGAGYLIGLISARLLWKKTNPPRQRQRTPTRDRQTRADDPGLITALNALSTEVGKLRVAMESDRGEGRSRRGMKTVESSSDFVSARGDSVDSDGDEFFDITTPIV